jgi:hypothetical protein
MVNAVVGFCNLKTCTPKDMFLIFLLFCHIFYFANVCSSDGMASPTTEESGLPSKASNRLVKWINRRNVRRQFEKHKIRKTTKDQLFGRRGDASLKKGGNDATAGSQTIPNEKSLLDSCDDDDDDQVYCSWTTDNDIDETQPSSVGIELQASSNRPRKSGSVGQWECIPRDSHIELCAIPTTMTDVEG